METWNVVSTRISLVANSTKFSHQPLLPFILYHYPIKPCTIVGDGEASLKVSENSFKRIFLLIMEFGFNVRKVLDSTSNITIWDQKKIIYLFKTDPEKALLFRTIVDRMGIGSKKVSI